MVLWPVCFWERESEERKGGESMKRMITVLALALVLAAIVVATVAPAFAAQCDSGNNPHCLNPGGQPHGANQTFHHP
jgi:hypothetical protein